MITTTKIIILLIITAIMIILYANTIEPFQVSSKQNKQKGYVLYSGNNYLCSNLNYVNFMFYKNSKPKTNEIPLLNTDDNKQLYLTVQTSGRISKLVTYYYLVYYAGKILVTSNTNKYDNYLMYDGEYIYHFDKETGLNRYIVLLYNKSHNSMTTYKWISNKNNATKFSSIYV